MTELRPIGVTRNKEQWTLQAYDIVFGIVLTVFMAVGVIYAFMNFILTVKSETHFLIVGIEIILLIFLLLLRRRIRKVKEDGEQEKG